MASIDFTLTDTERDRLAKVLGPDLSVDDIATYVATAGAREALAYATGDAVFTSMADLRMYRVYQLIAAGLPTSKSEAVVAGLFKITATAARRLIANAFARYPVELNDRVATEVRVKLDEAVPAEGEQWRLSLPAGFVKDAVMSRCRVSDQPDPAHEHGSVWEFSNETYNWLRKEFSLSEINWSEQGVSV